MPLGLLNPPTPIPTPLSKRKDFGPVDYYLVTTLFQQGSKKILESHGLWAKDPLPNEGTRMMVSLVIKFFWFQDFCNLIMVSSSPTQENLDTNPPPPLVLREE